MTETIAYIKESLRDLIRLPRSAAWSFNHWSGFVIFAPSFFYFVKTKKLSETKRTGFMK